MEIFLYIGYIIIGIIWAIYIHGMIEDIPKYHEGYSFEITLVTNIIFWPVCMLALAYARIFLKRDTLFVDRED